MEKPQRENQFYEIYCYYSGLPSWKNDPPEEYKKNR